MPSRKCHFTSLSPWYLISKVALIIRLHRAVRRARQVYEFTKHCPVGLAQVNVWSVGVISVPVSVPGMLTASS